MTLISAAETAAMLRETGGVRVVKGSVTTYGHVRWTPAEVLQGQSGYGRGVQTAQGRVVIAAGILSGVTAFGDGIGDAITVDGVACKITGIAPPRGEEDGDMLDLALVRV